MSRGRGAFAASVILAAVALVLGFSSTFATASVAAKTRTVFVGKSPSQPVAGESFTIRFQLWTGRVPIHIAQAGCHAQIGNGPGLPLSGQGNNGTEGYCTWDVPANAQGKTFDGIIFAQADSGVRYYHGFDLPIS